MATGGTTGFIMDDSGSPLSWRSAIAGQRADVSGDDHLVVAFLHVDVVPALPAPVDDVGDYGLAILADGETPAADRFRSPRLEVSVNSHSTTILNAVIPCVSGCRILGTGHAATPIRTIRQWRPHPRLLPRVCAAHLQASVAGSRARDVHSPQVRGGWNPSPRTG